MSALDRGYKESIYLNGAVITCKDSANQGEKEETEDWQELVTRFRWGKRQEAAIGRGY